MVRTILNGSPRCFLELGRMRLKEKKTQHMLLTNQPIKINNNKKHMLLTNQSEQANFPLTAEVGSLVLVRHLTGVTNFQGRLSRCFWEQAHSYWVQDFILDDEILPSNTERLTKANYTSTHFYLTPTQFLPTQFLLDANTISANTISTRCQHNFYWHVLSHTNRQIPHTIFSVQSFLSSNMIKFKASAETKTSLHWSQTIKRRPLPWQPPTK